jgi:hypothetical protein
MKRQTNNGGNGLETFFKKGIQYVWGKFEELSERIHAHPKRAIGATVVLTVALGMIYIVATSIIRAGNWVSGLRLPWGIIMAVAGSVGALILFFWVLAKWRKIKSKTISDDAPPARPEPQKVIITRTTLKKDNSGIMMALLVVIVVAGIGYAIYNHKPILPAPSMPYRNAVPGHFSGNPRDYFPGPDRDSVIAFFSDPKDSILVEIAACESGFRQFEDLGRTRVLRGKINPHDLGVMQINEVANSDFITGSGRDISTLRGNMEVAQALYNERGTTPWNSSAPCWRDHEVPGGGGGEVAPQRNQSQTEAIAIMSGKIDTTVVYTTADGKWTRPVHMYGKGSRIVAQNGMDITICTQEVCSEGCTDGEGVVKPVTGIESTLPQHVDVMRFCSKQAGAVMVIRGIS